MATVSYSSGNYLLDALPPADHAEFAADLDIVRLAAHEATHSVGARTRFVDFPIDAVLSVVVMLKNGDTIEVGTVGRESFVEVNAVLASPLAQRTSFCQVGGAVGRMSIDRFVARMGESASFADAMRRNVGASLFSAQQFAACNVKHAPVQRCARWLAMTEDRVGATRFALSNAFLAIMIGVDPSIVADSVEKLVGAGIMTYARGIVAVHDSAALQAHACECYAACKAAFDVALRG